jgi:hypothetical protein
VNVYGISHAQNAAKHYEENHKRSVILSPMSCSARWNNAGRGRGREGEKVLLNTYLCVENVRFCFFTKFRHGNVFRCEKVF